MRKTLSLLLLALCMACNYPTTGVVLVSPTPPQPTTTPSATPLPILLPHSLYFLSQRSGSAQVWRLETDGVTLSQVTTEATAVDGYDVSAADGSVAYVVSNQIYMVNADGSERRLLVDNAAANSQEPDFFYTQIISTPRFSPDGSKLAYSFGGAWVFDLATSEAQLILENELDGNDPVELYGPVEWAPDNSQLLIAISREESSTLGVWSSENDELVRLESEDLVCCQPSWAPDSRSVLLASATLGIVEPGLWRFDSQTGEQSTLIETISGEVYNFVAWPLQVTNGDLQYFYNSAADLPEGDVPFYIVRSSADGNSGRSQLRSDAFSLREALWAADGSLVLAAQPATGGDGTSGPVVLAFTDERPLQVLLDDGFELRWGP